MAEESQDGQEKTEDPSQRKLEKSAEDGKVLYLERDVCLHVDVCGLSFNVCNPFLLKSASFWSGLFHLHVLMIL